MDAHYAHGYRRLYEQHWWWRAREEIVFRELVALARPGRERILDVGCGDGLFLERLASLGEAEGIEPFVPVSPDRAHLRIATQPLDASFEPGKRYTLVLLLDVLEHLARPEDALAHALRLLEPEGHIVITVPAREELWTSHDEVNHHLRRYTRPSLAALAARAGLELWSVRYLFHWTYPAKLLLRAKERITRRASPAATVPPAPVNRMLYGLSMWEQRALSRLRPAFGSSLLAVGGHPIQVSKR
jgi:SAM-dependent methyltransferase